MGCQVSTAQDNKVRPSVYTPSDPFEDYLKRIGSNDTYESKDVSVNLYKSRRNSHDFKIRCSSLDPPAPLVRNESICIIPEALRECEDGTGDFSQKPSEKSCSPTEQLLKKLGEDPELNESPVLSCRQKPGDLSLNSSFRRTRSPTDFMLSRSFDETDENLISFYRRKPSTGALIPEVINEHRSFSEPTFMLSKAFLPTPIQSQNNSDGHMSSNDSVRVSKIVVTLEEESAAPSVVNDEEAAHTYVHVDKSVTISCFAVQADSWYTAPRPYLRVKIIPFVWW